MVKAEVTYADGYVEELTAYTYEDLFKELDMNANIVQIIAKET